MLVGLSLLLGTSSCQLTMPELKALNPAAETLEVHCHPSLIPEHVKRFALQRGTHHIVTDEDQDELRSYAPLAGVFIEVNPAAPIENAAMMASTYGLFCPNMPSAPTSSPEPLRNEEPCSTDATSSNRPTHSNLVANVGQRPCDSSGQSKDAKKVPVRIKVCVRPSWVPKPYKDAKGKWVTVNEWAIFLGENKVEWTRDPGRYAEQIAKNADVIFTLDESAPLESAYYFTKDTKKLSCAGGPPKKSYDEVAGSGTMPMLSEVTAASEAKEKAAAKAKQGNGKTTSTSSPDGSGPPLDPFETLARELMFMGKLVTTDTSAPATTADGSRHGMSGGKNVGGFSFPALQAGVGLVSIVIGVGMKPQDFIKKVIEKTSLGKPVIVKELNADALKLADEFIKDYGQYVMAESLRKQQVILPYGMASKFTAKLEAKFQAHKIFERRAIEEVMKKQNPALSKAALKKAVDEVAKTYPSIILTDAKHTEISKALNAAWAANKKINKEMTKEKLREIYKDVYKKEPHWLEAIESYLR